MTKRATKAKQTNVTTAAHSSPAPLIDTLEVLSSINAADILDSLPNNKFSIVNKTAEHELDYALRFLLAYNGSSPTFNAYRRDIERLLQWSWRIAERSAIELGREDIENFIQFVIDPPSEWIGEKHVAR